MAVLTNKQKTLPVKLNTARLHWLVIGGGMVCTRYVRQLLQVNAQAAISIVSTEFHPSLRQLSVRHHRIQLLETPYTDALDHPADAVIIATGNDVIDEQLHAQARQRHLLTCVPTQPALGDFNFQSYSAAQFGSAGVYWLNDKAWKRILSRIIITFSLMVFGYFAITYLPLPTWKDSWSVIQPHITYQLFFFMLAGFLAQMVDGVLGMGYGVTSATCLMAFGVNPVAMSASIHTSEIFTTGVSGYSHYRFGNVNKKLFRHLVIPGAIGAVAGALLLVYLGDHYGKYLMPVIAVYAGFLGFRILYKAFREPTKGKKVKRIGWLAAAGGFLDSFGGGGWGPIVTSSLMAKGRSPRYTIGSVNLTEFFVTLSSAFAFFLTIGVTHWTIVLGLLVGGSIAAPIAAKLAGKLPRKTMMIGVGLMVIIWCIRMLLKSI